MNVRLQYGVAAGKDIDISVGKERGDKYQAQYNYKGEKYGTQVINKNYGSSRRGYSCIISRFYGIC